MRVLLAVAWLLVPVGAMAWHYGSTGQDLMKLDDAAKVVRLADAAAKAGQHAQAAKLYDEALKSLPENKQQLARRLRIEKAKANMMSQKLVEAHADLHALVSEIQADAKADPKLATDARHALANAQYYAAWGMRLEGVAPEQWEPEIDAARQSYRLLAEEAAGRGDETAAKQFGEDVEASIRLARLDLTELQALPLPCQCNCKCSGCCNGKKPGKKPGKNPGDQTARGASAGPPPDKSGH